MLMSRAAVLPWYPRPSHPIDPEPTSRSLLLYKTTMSAPQIDGAYPRLNAAMVATGQYNGQLVSLVGKFVSPQQFECSDRGQVQLDAAHADVDQIPQGVAVEIMGQVQGPTQVAVRTSNYKKEGVVAGRANPWLAGLCQAAGCDHFVRKTNRNGIDSLRRNECCCAQADGTMRGEEKKR